MKIAFRFFIIMFSNVKWFIFLSTLQAQLNNSFNIVTELASNEIVYEFKTKKLIIAVDVKVDNISDNILNRRLKYQRETADVIVFAQVKTKIYYDVKHQFILFHFENKVYFRLHHEYQLSDRFNRKMFNQRCESFTVKRRVDRLAYELKLSAHWKIHSIISITQLKSCFNQSNSYNRFRSNYLAFVEVEKNIDDWKSYIVERIVNKRFRKFERITITQYMIKWSNYKSKFNE